MAKKKKFDLYEVKSVATTTLIMFSPVIIVLLQQLQEGKLDTNVLHALAIGVILKSFQKFLQDNPTK